MKFPFLDAKARLVRIMGTFDLATGHGDTMDELLDSLESELRDVLGHYRQRREWVGLTDELEALFTNIDHAISSGAWNVQKGSQTWEIIEHAKAAHGIKEKNT